MNIAGLIEGAPELLNGLQKLGMTDSNVQELGQEVGRQLVDDNAFDFSDLLTGLDAQSFLKRVNVPVLAEKLCISPELAQQAIGLVAPFVADFGVSKKGLLGKLAGGLFGNR